MAIYHFSAKPVQRSKGRSSVAAAAYRSRSTLRDERQGMTFSYIAATDLVHAEIVGFGGPRASLWNMAEAVEVRHDATTSREYEIALPNELSEAKQIELARDFARWLNKNQGCAVDFAIHSGGGVNGHCHFLTTTRSLDEDGTMSDIKIQREWSDKKRKAHGLPGRKAELVAARKAWADIANNALERSGFGERIDHRSLKDQGVDRLPTSHIGPAASAMEREGMQTRVGDHNRMIIGINLQRQYELDDLRNRESQVESLTQQLADIDLEIEAIRNEPAPAPTITGTIVQADHSTTIAAVAEWEVARYSTGMAMTFGDMFKGKLLKETWNADFPPELLKTLKWVDINSRALTMKSGSQIVDHGDKITLSKHEPDAVAATVEMIKAKGWESVTVNGSDEFQLAIALALYKEEMKVSLKSELAKERYEAELSRRQAPPEALKPIPELDRLAEPEPEIDLYDLVRRSTDTTPLPPTNAYRDDTRKLRSWARARWSELTTGGEPEGLAETFVTVMEEQALMAGYSPYEIKDVGLDSGWSKTMSDRNKKPALSPRPAARTQWACSPNEGEKPPGI